MSDRSGNENDDRAVEEPRTDTIERLARMTQAEVDDLPYGFIVLDAEGVVLLYNRYEESLSRVPAERVVGRNFFREIAPCTRVEAFYGRFRALSQQPPGTTERFAFRFHFLHGAQDVFVQFARAPDDRIFMTVHRRPSKAHGDLRPATLQQDLERGRLSGPVGVIFPLAWDHAPALLHRIGAGAARELGRGFGKVIAELAEDAVVKTGAKGLGDAPAPLAVGAIDDATALLGLGRLGVDLTGLPRRAGCFIRPPVESPSVELSALYEGLIEVALSAAFGAPHVARCIEGSDLEAVPWRFVLVPAGELAELRPMEGEQPDDRARRLGVMESVAETSPQRGDSPS